MLESVRKTAARPVVDGEAHNRLMQEVSAFGGGPDGAMTRLTLSKEDGQARDWLAEWMRKAGLRVEVDAIGNMYGFLDWAGPDAPAIMTGSHIDSQPNGGRFDGAYGVIAACSAVEAIQKAVAETGVRPKANFIIVNWTNEEGARFQPSLLGSGVNSGEHTLEFALSRKDGNGVSVAEALRAIGYDGSYGKVIPDALIELHIEGGPTLEKSGKRFAAIDRYWGATKYRVAFVGRQAHTGPTPMAERRDALLGAAYLIADIRAIADEAGVELHTSVGRLEVYPNSPNVVPAEAVLSIELRSADPQILEAAEEKLKARIATAAGRAGIQAEIRQIDRRKAGALDAGLYKLAEEVAAAFGEETAWLDSIGGHDSISMAAVTKAIVINVPSVGGVIHHPNEFTTPEDRVFGVEVLTAMLWRFCVDGNVLEV
ncbi:Zn-dependent hydrolase [Mesorhizobium sp. J428]|uniref:Zn-dependent hydrolase n=1 Tax=Mesorhizobium sp. J428 TaxID=2898440 RepID=UPI002150DA5B|nr:Zn-dependent hydrolase [Mesorhizobium sp. J428]MCR5859396.1 Zn-dependent hydrolase [Mesorhizobium sp. J428]